MSDHGTVCIVDDDEAVRDSLKLLLEMSGRQVCDFPSGDALIDDMPDDAACLILDYHMPIRNGLEVLADLRARRFGMPAILITGLGDPLIRRRASEAGVVAVLDKPFSDDTIIAAVSAAMDMPQAD